MTRTTVVNKHHKVPFDVYIGRGSIWGNPFVMNVDGTRDEVIKMYRDYLFTRPDLIARIPTLHGKVLGCYCKPKPCHGDILADIANALS